MATKNKIPSLQSLNYSSYLNNDGLIDETLCKKIGVYAIFNKDKHIQFIGYSRDIYLSLKQHLVRQPDNCYWLKFEIIDHPNRSILEEIKMDWISQYENCILKNREYEAFWTQPIDAKIQMTEEDRTIYANSDEISQVKLLKKIARQVQNNIEKCLLNRGSNVEIRFNPKLKEKGLLDLK
ncbi:GIY-YIG nuclease family protein [Candidatus Atelocyanobacterium thalassae]|uniref:Nuclease subunit of the excinuclease complex n=1 Tax=cyanobacterium endosymbiont of Braarudosphaera bigelowii TaxID=1285375 RepID=A0ABM7U3Q3_9CHRO|nr:GIY-YIG nuclease family protein [Candidatus Atelocyanobacterium thalassa]BDA39328.1 hypothetical protein CPARK_000016700 [cyanobacterium endosymbiont of Braarudosphaera bigelowii]